MEEDGGVKAPVTRLRRRLSVEQSDDTRSPSAPSTPTKKRGGRLATKPQLELINENVSQNSPKRATRKSIARDIAEPEEKPMTPARRSTRIKSNTSIVSETAQSFDSPRAKRAAARRTSQVGSDNEAPVTPARTQRTRKDSSSSIDKQATPANVVTPGRTRRTRKNSTSSIDKQDETTVATSKPLITEIITEEPETNLRKSASTDDTNEDTSNQSSPGSLRKSPRLTAKKGRNSHSSTHENIENQSQNSSDQVTSSNMEVNDKDMGDADSASNIENALDVMKSNIVEKDKLSISSTNLLNDMDVEPKNKKSSLNRSESAVTLKTDLKNKRNRTKSWTTLSMTPPTNENFYSDNESTKRKLKKQEKKITLKRLSNQTGSGDGPDNTEEVDQTDCIQDIIINTSSKKKNKRDQTNEDTSVNESTHNKANLNQSSPNIPKEKDNEIGSETESNKENLFGKKDHSLNSSATQLFYEKGPVGVINSMVFIEDSDTETGFKIDKEKQSGGGDQCVPVVYQESPKKPTDNDSNAFNNIKEKLTNDNTCEPMDIDETMPENVSLTEYSHEDKLERSSRKSSVSFSKEVDKNANETPNKSKIKSFISHSMSQELEKTGNDNKTTLILSIKDVSSTENCSESPIESKTETLSKSMTIPDVAKDELINNKKSLTYSTSTPVQNNKKTKKTAVEINTSVITPNSISKKDVTDSMTKFNKKDVSMSSKSSKYDSAEAESEEESAESSNMLDDEAQDAGDDYESGDSQDEEERQYEEEHEILEKGETLDSDDEISNDSDYEKDSFLVSSDEEDDNLLSGSGDDLAMSDNELTMSAKSKKKYNERKQKEQKKASKEMFEARHNESAKHSKSETSISKKNNRLRLDSTLLNSDDDNKVPPKKNKRMRLNSSMTKSDSEELLSNKNNSSVNNTESEEIGYKKKKSKRLSESMCDDNAINEKEITVVPDGNLENDDPLLVKVKPEPKTPQKDLSISTCHINDNIEEVQIEDNVSMMKPNDTRDPLQASMAEDESDMSSISENEEISKNYESVLAHLNNENKAKKIKSCDVSLNLNKKAKKKAEHPIVDELNLTQIKPKTKKPKSTEQEKNYEKSAVEKLNNYDEESSSDSIDLKLLFSDDSSSESSVAKNDNDGCENVEKIIPLKRTEGKTNLRKSLNSGDEQESGDDLNGSNRKDKKINTITETISNEITETDNVLNINNKKKQKKRNTSQNEDNTATGGIDNDEENINFFIDTTGMHDNSGISANVSLNTSSKKKKKNNKSFQMEQKESTDAVDSDDTPAEISYQSSKNKKFKKSIDNNISEEVQDLSISISATKTPGSEKKKKKISLSQDVVDSVVILSTSLIKNTSMENSKLRNNNSFLEKSISEKTSQDNREENKTVDVEKNLTSSKKRKRKSSTNMESVTELISKSPKSLLEPNDDSGSQKKKRKISHNDQDTCNQDSIISQNAEHTFQKPIENNLKKNENYSINDKQPTTRESATKTIKSIDKMTTSKKRKERDDDDSGKISKVHKQNSCDKIHVPRLPTTILNQLDDKPRKEVLEMKKSKVVSTTDFMVEESRKRKAKPSNYLEESVYLNADESLEAKKHKTIIKKPKVLPFIPTASTSDSGFTTNFQVSVIPNKIEFVARRADVAHFKNDYLQDRKIKKLRTYDLFKHHRNVKLSKF